MLKLTQDGSVGQATEALNSPAIMAFGIPVVGIPGVVLEDVEVVLVVGAIWLVVIMEASEVAFSIGEVVGNLIVVVLVDGESGEMCRWMNVGLCIMTRMSCHSIFN